MSGGRREWRWSGDFGMSRVIWVCRAGFTRWLGLERGYRALGKVRGACYCLIIGVHGGKVTKKMKDAGESGFRNIWQVDLTGPVDD